MTESNDHDSREPILGSTELERGFQEYSNKLRGCPPFSQFEKAAQRGWRDSFVEHVASGCVVCLKRTAMQWSIAPPSISALLRHFADNTFPHEEFIAKYVTEPSEASRISAILRICRPLKNALASFVANIAPVRPMEMTPSASTFAPSDAVSTNVQPMRFIHEGLAWSAPVESRNQMVYVQATAPASVIVVVSGAPGSLPNEDPDQFPLQLVQLSLRGTEFRWRVAHSLGPADRLTARYGREYEVVVLPVP